MKNLINIIRNIDNAANTTARSIAKAIETFKTERGNYKHCAETNSAILTICNALYPYNNGCWDYHATFLSELELPEFEHTLNVNEWEIGRDPRPEYNYQVWAINRANGVVRIYYAYRKLDLGLVSKSNTEQE